jgi:acetate kinase
VSAPLVLTLNAGSSSVKFALFEAGAGGPSAVASGQVEAIGGAARFRVKQADGTDGVDERHADGAALRDHGEALARILGWIEAARPGAGVAAVGHRVVHGGPGHAAPAAIDAALLADLARLEPLAPLHQPHNLAGVRAAIAAFPAATQVACFDTAFHRHQSELRQAFAIPRRLFDAGVRRYGFHGLSYEYVAARLKAGHPDLHAGRVVVAHLGNGASMAALVGGRSVASTMGFTALDGLVMGTRCGSIDPGVLLYLAQVEGMAPDGIAELLYEQSGLLGLSGLSNDMRALEASDDPAAAFAIDAFVDRAVRAVGELAAAMEGLDALVFTAGIGENSAGVRARIASRLGWLGLDFDAAANDARAPRVSVPGSRVAALVIPTDEEAMIAAHALDVARAADVRRAAQ